jgi:hypothetical protein
MRITWILKTAYPNPDKPELDRFDRINRIDRTKGGVLLILQILSESLLKEQGLHCSGPR